MPDASPLMKGEAGWGFRHHIPQTFTALLHLCIYSRHCILCNVIISTRFLHSHTISLRPRHEVRRRLQAIQVSDVHHPLLEQRCPNERHSGVWGRASVRWRYHQTINRDTIPRSFRILHILIHQSHRDVGIADMALRYRIDLIEHRLARDPGFEDF